MIERKFETLLTQYGQAMQKLAVSDSADRERTSAKAVRAKAILRSFLKDELEAARATAEQSRDSVIEECAKVCESAIRQMRSGQAQNGATVCATQIRALRSQQDAAIESKPAEPSAWQPIATAPPEGQFLVYMPDEHRQPIQVAKWHPNVKVIGNAFAFDLAPPTHWMPLPATPVESQRSGDGS